MQGPFPGIEIVRRVAHAAEIGWTAIAPEVAKQKRGGEEGRSNEPIRDRRRNDGRDPIGFNLALTSWSRSESGCVSLSSSSGHDLAQIGPLLFCKE